jgi:predicted cobalt transporter CbtA
MGMLSSVSFSTSFNVVNGFIPFRLTLADALSISFPGGRREVFLFLGLAGNLSCFFNGFLGLDPHQLD